VTDIASREADFQFFTSERARSLLSAAEIKLLSYKTIRTAMRDSRERARDESNDRNLRIEAQTN
jgi:hypothetical protein